MTFEKLLIGYDRYNVTYAKKGGISKYISFEKVEEVIQFINKNIYDINLLCINDVMLDINKIIEKYEM